MWYGRKKPTELMQPTVSKFIFTLMNKLKYVKFPLFQRQLVITCCITLTLR